MSRVIKQDRAVELQGRLAGFPSRVLADGIDLAIAFGIFVLIYSGFSILWDFFNSDTVQIKVQSPGFLRRKWDADDPGCMTDDERHLFWRAQACRNEQIALVLAVVVVGHDDEFASRKGSDGGLDTLMRVVHRLVIPARRRNAVVPNASTLGLFVVGMIAAKPVDRFAHVSAAALTTAKRVVRRPGRAGANNDRRQRKPPSPPRSAPHGCPRKGRGGRSLISRSRAHNDQRYGAG